jgi:C1A family cysteine protease
MPKFKYALGCIEEAPDSSDRRLTRLPRSLWGTYPPKVDRSSRMSPVSDQGPEAAGVGFAVVDGVMEYLEQRDHKKPVQLSVRYVYEEARKLGKSMDGEGASIRSAMKVLNSKGVPPQSCWEYRAGKAGKPCPDVDKHAMKNRIESYVCLKSLDEMRECLLMNGPFVAGITVHENAWNAAEGTGVVRMPERNDPKVGGHAICIVGYDDLKKRFKFKNSWGTGWGKKGYGFIPYDYVLKRSLGVWSASDLLGHKDVLPLLEKLVKYGLKPWWMKKSKKA